MVLHRPIETTAVTGEVELASLFCSDESPEIEHLRFSVIYGHSGLINRVAFRKIRNDSRTNDLNTFYVFLRNPPGEVGSNLNVSVFQSAGDANQSVRDLPKQGTLDGKFERQERLERVHDGEYSGILTVKAKRVSLNLQWAVESTRWQTLRTDIPSYACTAPQPSSDRCCPPE